MGKKVNMEAAKSNLVNDLKDATIEQLDALIAELNSTRENLENKQLSARFIVTTDIDAMLVLYDKLKKLILPQIEFDVKILTDVYEFNAYIERVLSEKSNTISPVEFKRSMRALSMTTFKGAEHAVILNDFALLLNNVSKEIAALDESYKLNAQMLDKAINEKELKMIDKNAEDISTTDK